MSDDSVLELIAKLEAEIAEAEGEARRAMRAELHRMVHRLQQDGHPVPQRLQDLDQQLTDEAVESQFDNMPI